MSQVDRLIAGPGVYICNECIGLCNEIIEEEQTPAPSGMRRILLRSAMAYLLLAVSARAADALGVGGVRFHCGCDESCWCKRPSLTLFRWVTPRGWHHIGLTPDEKRARIER